MKLWRRILAENRLVTMSVLGTLLATTVFYLGGVYPLERRVNQLHALKARTTRDLGDAQDFYRRTRATLEREAMASTDLERFYGEILPNDLSTARDVTHVKLAELAAGTNLVMERRSSQSVPAEFDGLVRLRTNMLLAGQWRDIRSFIAAVEGGSDFLVIENMVLSQRADRSVPVTLTIEVATYYRPGV